MDVTALARSLLDPIPAHRTAGIEVLRAADGAAEVGMVVPPTLHPGSWCAVAPSSGASAGNPFP